jgi:hypothetical protein
MTELYEAVKTYDPAKEIIMVVGLYQKGRVYPFQLSQEPYRPKAYQKRRHVFKE